MGMLWSEPGIATKVASHQMLRELATRREGSGVALRQIGAEWQLHTPERFASYIVRLRGTRPKPLSRAAMEVLSVIAYRQPVLRAEIEAIRGVACGEVLRGLMDRRLVRIAGRAEEVGRPILYGTTRDFLQLFGLAGIDDLPEVDGLQRASSYSKPKRSVESETEAATETAAESEAAAEDVDQQPDSDSTDGEPREPEAAAN